jgi:hypothetical protein
MAFFTTRIELHEASLIHYKRLKTAMIKHGFTKTIENEVGTKYVLPTATYSCETDKTADEVLSYAISAAKTVGKAYSIIVTKSAGRAWVGLPKA